jgi:hypothetical protein|tara:strand:- start:1291 stop:1485 length:195 start_codon:yes stop_codon:yes gene_type:complete
MDKKYTAKIIAFTPDQLICIDLARAHMQNELMLKLSRSNALARLCKIYLKEKEAAYDTQKFTIE